MLTVVPGDGSGEEGAKDGSPSLIRQTDTTPETGQQHNP
jgi:hypothetical protein